jgi:proline iminopeptidase
LRALCDALGIEKPVVLGQSFGGMVAMEYAARHPEAPSKLVLSSTAARLDPLRICETLERLGGKEARAIGERYLGNPTPESTMEYLRNACLCAVALADGGFAY